MMEDAYKMNKKLFVFFFKIIRKDGLKAKKD